MVVAFIIILTALALALALAVGDTLMVLAMATNLSIWCITDYLEEIGVRRRRCPVVAMPNGCSYNNTYATGCVGEGLGSHFYGWLFAVGRGAGYSDYSGFGFHFLGEGVGCSWFVESAYPLFVNHLFSLEDMGNGSWCEKIYIDI